jgi:hypothetical protein
MKYENSSHYAFFYDRQNDTISECQIFTNGIYKLPQVNRHVAYFEPIINLRKINLLNNVLL